jgi:hypothetical protein
MANASGAQAGKYYVPPSVNGDFYGITNLLAPDSYGQRRLLWSARLSE